MSKYSAKLQEMLGEFLGCSLSVNLIKFFLPMICQMVT